MNILEVIFSLILFFTGIVLCHVAVYYLIPRIILRERYYLGGSVGRGLKKFKYEGGRGVLYEPHPSARKYIRSFALFTRDGYKHVMCRIGAGVNSLKYDVFMINISGKVIDSISVSEDFYTGSFTQPQMLHEDTSYIAISITEANGKELTPSAQRYYKLFDVAFFAVFMTVISFAILLLINFFMSSVIAPLTGDASIAIGNVAVFIIPSVIIAALCSVIVLASSAKKGIKVVVSAWK